MNFDRKGWVIMEEGVPMLSLLGLNHLAGTEYVAKVTTTIGTVETRLLGKIVTTKHGELWADTTTGSLYREDGQCKSGMLNIVGTPKKTGRKIPKKDKREREAVARFSKSQYAGGFQ